MDAPKEFVDFIIHYRDIVAIKRMRIMPNTRPEEVAFTLAGIRRAISSDRYRIMGIDVEGIKDIIKMRTAGATKRLAALSSYGRIINDEELLDELKSTYDNPALKDAARACLLLELMEAINQPAFMTQKQLSRIYKDLKVKKFGRYGKKKKAESSM